MLDPRLEPESPRAIDPIDRRQSVRSPLYMMVRARDMGRPLWATDIGLGGMLCKSEMPRWPGTYLDLSFRLPDSLDELRIGGQVLSLDDLDDGVSLGVRFCMLSVKAQRAIYRFLDRRRALWGAQAEIENGHPYEPVVELGTPPETPLQLEPRAVVEPPERPFEALLLEAHASMRAKEQQHIVFVRSLPTDDLPRLSSLVRSV